MWLAQKNCKVNSKTRAKRWKNETVNVGDHTHQVLSLKSLILEIEENLFIIFFLMTRKPMGILNWYIFGKNLLAIKGYESLALDR